MSPANELYCLNVIFNNYDKFFKQQPRNFKPIKVKADDIEMA